MFVLKLSGKQIKFYTMMIRKNSLNDSNCIGPKSMLFIVKDIFMFVIYKVTYLRWVDDG